MNPNTTQSQIGIVVHGGAGTPSERSSELIPAVQSALDVIQSGGSALDAAVAAVVVLEDNPALNAGTGANIRMDGETVQMDAAAMDGNGNFGAVSVIERVKNPVKVARAVMDTPHMLLSGEGAIRFARTLGMEPYDPRTDASIARYERLLERMRDGTLMGGYEDFDWKKHWNFPQPLDDVLKPSDTVGAVVHDGKGNFAAAISTGGTSVTLHGRVGDVPIYGAGNFANENGAACATGWGEYIIRERLSQTSANFISNGANAQAAAEHGIGLFPNHIGVGLITVNEDSIGAHANRPMAWAGYTNGEFVQADK